jgi:hypothetical protein
MRMMMASATLLYAAISPSSPPMTAGDQGGHDAHQQGYPGTGDDPGEDIAAVVVGAEPVGSKLGAARRLIGSIAIGILGQQRADERQQHHEHEDRGAGHGHLVLAELPHQQGAPAARPD